MYRGVFNDVHRLMVRHLMVRQFGAVLVGFAVVLGLHPQGGVAPLGVERERLLREPVGGESGSTDMRELLLVFSIGFRAFLGCLGGVEGRLGRLDVGGCHPNNSTSTVARGLSHRIATAHSATLHGASATWPRRRASRWSWWCRTPPHPSPRSRCSYPSRKGSSPRPRACRSPGEARRAGFGRRESA